MEAVKHQKPSTIKSFIVLAKPGIVMGNLMATAAGFVLASRQMGFDGFTFLMTILGMAFVMASGCVLNNYIDKMADSVMRRTKMRPLVTGEIATAVAFVYASFLGALGFTALYVYTNAVTVAIAITGFVMYVGVYSFVKYATPLATQLGSIAGAVPPVAGYAAVYGRLDVQALLLFIILVAWQMPHFYAIAHYRIEDYRKASIPVLPLKKGAQRTFWEMLGYIVVFLFATAALVHYGSFHAVNYMIVIALSLAWIKVCLEGLTCQNKSMWGRKMLRISLLVLNIWFITLWVHFLML